jgi:hypothetical protein
LDASSRAEWHSRLHRPSGQPTETPANPTLVLRTGACSRGSTTLQRLLPPVRLERQPPDHLANALRIPGEPVGWRSSRVRGLSMQT